MNCVEMLDNVLCMTMFRQYLSCIISLSVNMETLKKTFVSKNMQVLYLPMHPPRW